VPEYTSLDGLKGNFIEYVDHSGVTATPAPSPFIPANPRRKWAVIQNPPGATTNLNIFLVPKAAGLSSLDLVPGGTLLINETFHFTGALYVADDAGAAGTTVIALEAVVMP